MAKRKNDDDIVIDLGQLPAEGLIVTTPWHPAAGVVSPNDNVVVTVVPPPAYPDPAGGAGPLAHAEAEKASLVAYARQTP